MKKTFCSVISYLLMVICVNAQTTSTITLKNDGLCDKCVDGVWREPNIPAFKIYSGTLSKYEPQKIAGDTLLISDTSIHFIQIGDQTFEIKRTVTLVPAQAPGSLKFYMGSGNATLINGTVPYFSSTKKDNSQ